MDNIILEFIINCFVLVIFIIIAAIFCNKLEKNIEQLKNLKNEKNSEEN